MTTLPKSFPWKYFFERLKKFIQRTFLESGLEFWENWALFTAGAFSGAYHLKHLRKEILECSYRLIKNGSEDHRKVFFRLYHVNLRVNQSAKDPKISPEKKVANKGNSWKNFLLPENILYQAIMPNYEDGSRVSIEGLRLLAGPISRTKTSLIFLYTQ